MTRSSRAIRCAVLCMFTLAAASCGGEPPVVATPPVTPVPGATTPGATVGGAVDPVTGLPVATTPAAPTATIPELVGDDTSVGSNSFGSGSADDLFEPGGFASSDEFDSPLADPEDPANPSAPPGATPLPAPEPEPAEPEVKYTSAKIYVDGMVYTVERDGTFPKGNPLFRLTSVSFASIEIELVAGEFTAGGANGTVVDRGQLLTLANASEGKVYRIKFLTPIIANSGMTL